MKMDKELLFCDRCGYVTYSDSYDKIGDSCQMCNDVLDGHLIGAGISYDDAKQAIMEEQGMRRYDDIESEQLDEALRQKYYYDKLDQRTELIAINRRKYKESDEYKEAVSRRFREQQQISKQHSTPNIPKCPSCGSTNLTKLSTAGKVAKISFFGIFGAGNLGKTYKCNNCGVKF